MEQPAKCCAGSEPYRLTLKNSAHMISFRQGHQSNVVRFLSSRETVGSRCYGNSSLCLEQIHSQILRRIDGDHHGMISLLKLLDEGVRKQDLEVCKMPVLMLVQLISDRGNEQAAIESRKKFISLGGPFSFMRTLMALEDFDINVNNVNLWRMKNLIVNDICFALREIVVAKPKLAIDIGPQHVINGLFQLLDESLFFENAIGLLEELIVARSEKVDLNDVPRLGEIIQNFTPRQLGYFCRLASLLVFESQDVIFGETLIESMKKKKESSKLVIHERNRIFLADIPGFIEGIIHILRLGTTIPSGHWIEQVIQRFPTMVDIVNSLLGVDLLGRNETVLEQDRVGFLFQQQVVGEEDEEEDVQMTSGTESEPQHTHTHHLSSSSIPREMEGMIDTSTRGSSYSHSHSNFDGDGDGDGDTSMQNAGVGAAGGGPSFSSEMINAFVTYLNEMMRVDAGEQGQERSSSGGGGGEGEGGQPTPSTSTNMPIFPQNASSSPHFDHHHDPVSASTSASASGHRGPSGMEMGMGLSGGGGGVGGVTSTNLVDVMKNHTSVIVFGIEMSDDPHNLRVGATLGVATRKPIVKNMNSHAFRSRSSRRMPKSKSSSRGKTKSKASKSSKTKHKHKRSRTSEGDGMGMGMGMEHGGGGGRQSIFEFDFDDHQQKPPNALVSAVLGLDPNGDDISKVDSFSLHSVVHSTFQVEAIFVLCMILHSARRRQVQEICVECGLVPIMDELWDKLSWDSTYRKELRPCSLRMREADEVAIVGDHIDDCNSEVGEADGPHGPGCQCNHPGNALRVQVLRLVHSFSELDEAATAVGSSLVCSGRSVDTETETESGSGSGKGKEMEKEMESKDKDESYFNVAKFFMTVEEAKGFNPSYFPSPYISELHSRGPESLFLKLLQSLMKQKQDSAYAFWMTSGLETLLRSGGAPFQNACLKHGLIDFLLKVILDDNDRFTIVGTMQGFFDLLAELVKFNREAFLRMDEYFTDKPLQALITVIFDRIVDSNVFLRTALASLDRFALEDQNTGPVPALSFKLGTYINDRANRRRIFGDLLASISVDELNADNVCCLNTIMVIMILVKTRQLDDAFVDMLLHFHQVSIEATLKNFKELLIFWAEYYKYRSEKDKDALALGSGFPFSVWEETRVWGLEMVERAYEELALKAKARLATATAKDKR